jgi:formylglycine-generating enzyme required for sulfatase activity
LTREVRQTWESLLANWFARQPDKGTHSAAGWALRKWQRPLPEIAPSRQPAKGLEWHVNSLGMTMLAIAPGEFIRKDDSGAKSSQPAVTVTQAFLISDREVSIGMYRQFLDDPNCPEPEKPQERPDLIGELTPTNLHSVHNVNWYDAVLFCNWLSRKEGLQACYERTGTKEKDSEPSDAWRVHPAANGYRLPTEAEWEYACRAGTTTAYACGDDESLLEAYAVVRANRAEACGSKLPNGWGLFDMHGNVSEWCADAISPSDDAKGSTGATLRADRGGSWLHVAASCRSALRNAYSPTDRYLIVGFRVVAVPSPR